MKLNQIHNDSTLFRKLMGLRHYIAKGAQEIYDSWTQDDEYNEFGDGGICDAIAYYIASVLSENNIDCVDGGHEGDDHAYIIAYDDFNSYIVDIPYNVYEIGSGYKWSKINNVVFTDNDVKIVEVDRPDWIE